MTNRTALLNQRLVSGWLIGLLAVVVAAVLCSGNNSCAAAVATAFAQESTLLSDDAIDQIGEQVMNGNEFRSVRRRVLEQIPDIDVDKGFLWSSLGWIGERIGDAFGAVGDFFNWLVSGLRSPNRPQRTTTSTPSSGGLSFLGFADLITTLAIVAIVAILIVIIAMIVKSIDAKKLKRESLLSDLEGVLSDVVVPPGELAASTYESRAVNLANNGDYRLAIRELLLGSMSWVERAGLIRYRKGLTNRDYLRSVWRRQDKRSAFLATATQFEYVYFGRRAPTAEMFEQCLASFRGAFREEETPTAAV